jgi:hypothetical protein
MSGQGAMKPLSGHSLPAAAAVFAALVAAAGAGGSDPAVAELADGFEGADFAVEGGLYYRDNAEQAAGTVAFQSRVRRSGAGALALTVRPNCRPESEGCSERAEIWERTELRVPYDAAVWFGFAMRFDDPPPQDDHRYVVAQWKREIGPGAEGDFSPFLALRLRSGAMFATVETNHVTVPADAPRPLDGRCPHGWTPVWLRPDTDQMRFLIAADPSWRSEITPEFDRCSDALQTKPGPVAMPSPASGWHDYAFYSRPGPDGGGRVAVFVDGQLVVEAAGRIGHDDAGLGDSQYFKFGPYRDAGEGRWTMFYDNFRRSPRCERLLGSESCAAFE